MVGQLALVIFLSILTARGALGADEQRVDRLNATITIDVRLDYLTFLPRDYGKDPNKRWPLMIFLHGAGERGNDVQKVKLHGPPRIVANRPDFPFIVISPQCPDLRVWEPAVVNALIDKVVAERTVDVDRIYLTGLSMGGFGTWATAAAYPDRFAAIVPICGGGDPGTAAKIKDIPTWVFHGEKDKIVPIVRSEEMVKALNDAGGNVKFTRYPDATHDSWTKTYDNPELYEWLLSHRKQVSDVASP